MFEKGQLVYFIHQREPYLEISEVDSLQEIKLNYYGTLSATSAHCLFLNPIIGNFKSLYLGHEHLDFNRLLVFNGMYITTNKELALETYKSLLDVFEKEKNSK